MESELVSINRWVVKKIWHLYYGLLFSCQEEWCPALWGGVGGIRDDDQVTKSKVDGRVSTMCSLLCGNQQRTLEIERDLAINCRLAEDGEQ